MKILNVEDKCYPKMLKEIHNFPKKLYIEGNLENLNTNCIAIIGSRCCTEYGKKWCEIFVKELIKYDLTIVSGMAYGIDAIAHFTAIKGRGKTIAVLPSGLNNIYPKRNLKLYEEIIKSKGTIITEYLPETKANNNRFLERNRIVSGLSIATLVIEAAHRSGTSVTAKLAFSQNRDVYCIPGNLENIKSVGTNNLIKLGAKLVTSPQDIINNYNFLHRREPLDDESDGFEDVDDDFKNIYRLIKNEPIDLDIILRVSGESIADVMNKITILELKGKIVGLPGNRFIRRD